SFAFSRRAERRRPLPAGPCAEPGAGGDTDSDTDFLTAVEDRELLRWAGEEARFRDGSRPSRLAAAPWAPPDSLHPTEARQSQEQPNGASGPPISIPLQLPDKDIATGPQPTAQDYEAVPVGQFGLAMLRGMGWSQGQGIGRTFPRVVTPLEHRPRPRGLGLGAEAAPPGTPKPGEPSQGGPAVGDPVRIEAGPHRGVEGKVEALDPETGRALVRLQLGGQVVAVNQHGLRPVSTGDPSQFPTESPPRAPPALSQCLPVPSSSPQVPLATPLRRGRRRGRRAGPPHGGGRSGRSPPKRRGLREASLETVVPRGSSDRVMVVLGEHAGKVGQILEREPERGRALVQLGRDAVLPLPYDSICHYLGGGDDD
ncbi:GPKOW protein, partial [Aphelocoma coerulescens]|nr:GPKOW protein [Aphelocoma coerulescens]